MNKTVAYQWAGYLVFGSAVSILFSIAASQMLLGAALALLLFSGVRPKLPRMWLPLGLFLLGTLISLAFSPDPAAGLPQLKKMFVYLMLVVVFTCIREIRMARDLVLFWGATGAVTAAKALYQFAQKMQEAHRLGQHFYEYYVGARITGFMSHWMTFSEQEMLVLILVLAYLIFGPRERRITWIYGVLAAVIGLAVVLADTRSVWIATVVACLYLLWFWKRTAILIPLALVLGAAIVPGPVHERFASIVHPVQNRDSNGHRIVCWRTGLAMIEAHPLLGLGPEEVRAQFYRWVPADIPRPLPTGWYGHLHNIYIQYAAERGIPVMLMLLWMLVQILYDSWRALRKLAAGRSLDRFLLHGCAGCVMAIMISGFFEHNLGDSEVLTMFLTIVALDYLVIEQMAQRASPVPVEVCR